MRLSRKAKRSHFECLLLVGFGRPRNLSCKQRVGNIYPYSQRSLTLVLEVCGDAPVTAMRR